MNKSKEKKPTGKIIIAIDAGTDPVEVDCFSERGEPIKVILERANVTLRPGTTVTLGRKRVEDINKTTAKAGDTLVIAGKICNGRDLFS